MRSASFSDSELITGLISRDERVLKEYYAVYFQSIRHFVLTNTGNEEDARDLFQDSLLVMFQKLRYGHVKISCTPGTYLFAISKFLWLRELSRRKRTIGRHVEHDDLMDMDEDIVQLNEKNERLIFFRKYFEKLSENCRKVLSLFTEGHSVTEITRIMGFRTEQHTKNRRYRCKSVLIKNIRAVYDYNTISHGNNAHN